LLTKTDIRPGDLAWGTGLALGMFAATVFALGHVEARVAPTFPEVVRIRAVSTAEVAHPLPTLQPSAETPVGSRAPKRASSSRSTRSEAARKRTARSPTLDGRAEPQAEPQPEPEIEDRIPDAPSLPSLAADTDAELHEEAPGEGDDDLAELAISSYRGNLTRWISARFEVHGTGLSQSVLVGLRGKARIMLDGGRTIVDYEYSPTGNEPFDAAAVSTLEGLRGEAVPPPPEAYPGALQQVISVTFVCKASTCD